MQKNHEIVAKMGSAIARAFMPMMVLGTALAILLYFNVVETDSMYSAIITFILVEMITFFLSNFLTKNMLVVYILERRREARGVWFGFMECGCDKPWIKTLTKDELLDCKNTSDDGKVSKCWSCTANDESGCAKCKELRRDRLICRKCTEEMTVVKLWSKRIRWPLFKHHAKKGDGDAKNGLPAKT